MNMLIQKIRILPLLAVTLLAGGCSTPSPSGYGVNALNEDAVMRQQVANQDPVADKRGMYLSMIREMQGNGLYFASLAHINAFEQQYGSAPDVQLLRAHGLREAGQSAESETAYRQLLNTSSGAAAAQGLGLLAGARGDYDAAVAALRDAARRDPTNPLIVGDLGFALLLQGDTAGARLPIAQAAELAPSNTKIISNLALFLLVSGDRERANAVMQKANLAPNTRTAVIKLAADLTASARIPVVAPAPGGSQQVAIAGSVVPDMASVAEPRSMAISSRRPIVAAVGPGSAEPPLQSLLDRFGSLP